MALARQAMVEELPIQIDKIGRDWLSATAFDPMELAEHSLV
jgi:hypothetical protein